MIQFDRLQDVVTATETLPLGEFNMGIIANACGTVGCMIGNYNAMIHRDMHTFGDYQHFGISHSEYYWLFGRYIPKGIMAVFLPTSWDRLPGGAEGASRSDALARLRKFIAYKRRKHDLLHDPKYGVSDQARKAEGNQLFAVLAVKDAMVELSLATAQ